MREQRSGLIVNISSIGGLTSLAATGYYHGTKYAVEGISESLALEVKPLGIDVLIVEPGAVPHQLGGPVDQAVGDAHRRLRRDRRRAPQAGRSTQRQTARRSGACRTGHYRRRAVGHPAVAFAARQGRARYGAQEARIHAQRFRCLGIDDGWRGLSGGRGLKPDIDTLATRLTGPALIRVHELT